MDYHGWGTTLMPTIDHPESVVWFIVHEGPIVHSGYVCPNTRMDTSLANLETFNSEEAMRARLLELV
jgi:hypothetical protein